jgi:mono/diheme cytochrome c family protein
MEGIGEFVDRVLRSQDAKRSDMVNRRSQVSSVIVGAALCVGMAVSGGGPQDARALFGSGDEEVASLVPVPIEYQGKKMPDGWWTDPKVIEAGRAIYEGKVNPEVKCFECHGGDGVPTRKGRGARDSRNAKDMHRYADDYWFWRISEGVPKTKMVGWKDQLTEEQRWQVMAYAHTFSHGGKAEPHDHPEQKDGAH